MKSYDIFSNYVFNSLDDETYLLVCTDFVEWLESKVNIINQSPYEVIREIIIDYWNGQKHFDNKTGNKFNRFGYYGFAQNDLDIAKRMIQAVEF